MIRISYAQAWADHEYLWTQYGPATDMTGGYVDSGDLDRLLRSPTKKTAAYCLCRQIDHWFVAGCEGRGRIHIADDKTLQEIAERHGHD